MRRSPFRAPPAGLTAAVTGLLGSGDPLPDGVRTRLERSAGTGLCDVRVHTGATAHHIAAALGSDAVSAGADVFFRAGAYRPDTEAGLRLVAHEVGHALDAPAGAGVVTGAGAERAADTFADAVLRGAAVPIARSPRPLHQGDPVALARHASWEHRLLGDAPAADLDAIAKRLPNRHQLLTDLRDFLYMWHADPDSVTPQMIAARYPYIRTATLTASGLLVTYGELNTLPDYLASPIAMDSLPRDILLPILQAVRQEGYNRVQTLLGGSTTTFKYSVASNWAWSFLDLLLETRAIDALTAGVGPGGTDHYTGLVARNACHFAPYSWYRWQAFYTIARTQALQAYQSTDPGTKELLTRQAWFNHGYADHFLQDSFAAGHLVNKTLVMQWFVEWAAGKWYVPVPNWKGCVETVTTQQQPLLWAPSLYDPANPGPVRDPQTAEEQPTLQQRMDMCGVRAYGTSSQEIGYRNYLAFLNSTVVQSSSGALHDYFNQNSVWAASAAHGQPFQLWGDDTMLNGGDGVAIASETAHLSQQSILDILATGGTAITVQQLLDRFPTSVSSSGPSGLKSLHDWNVGLRDFAFDQFFWLHYWALKAFPEIGKVSIDQPDFPPPAGARVAQLAAAGVSPT